MRKYYLAACGILIFALTFYIGCYFGSNFKDGGGNKTFVYCQGSSEVKLNDSQVVRVKVTVDTFTVRIDTCYINVKDRKRVFIDFGGTYSDTICLR
jgi:hypothetical protein